MIVDSIEKDLNNISELEDVTTTIKNGFFNILADIKEGSDNILVLQDVKDIISNLKRDLPSDMNEPSAKIKVHSFPLVLIALSADLPKNELLKYADELKDKLSKYKDLSDITIRGDADEELDINLDYQKIKAYGLNPILVMQAIRGISSIFPIGTIKQKANHLYISTINGPKTKKDLDDVMLSVGGKKVYLKDIASVSFKLSDERELSHYNGKRNISINVTKSKQGNAIELVKQIRELLKTLHKKHPQITYDIYTDTSIWLKIV
jgi:multidrug efflux pump subunit AcrB